MAPALRVGPARDQRRTDEVEPDVTDQARRTSADELGLEEDPLAKKIRKLGKVGNLSAQYRTGARTLMRVAATQHGVKLEYDESELVIRTYRGTYRRVPRYWNRQIQFAKRHGYVETMAGRRVNLGDYTGWTGSLSGKLQF